MQDEVLERCVKMWYRMGYRCRHEYMRKGIEVKMTKNQFLVWAYQRVKNFLYNHPGRTPTPDRIDQDGHYEIGNIRIMDDIDNRTRSRFIATYLGLTKLPNEREKIKVFAANIVATCINSGINKNNLLSYLRREI